MRELKALDFSIAVSLLWLAKSMSTASGQEAFDDGEN